MVWAILTAVKQLRILSPEFPGDRAANSALHIIAIGRLRTDPRSQAYVARRIAEGHSKLEAIRCLKRYIAREVYALIRQRSREVSQTQFAT